MENDKLAQSCKMTHITIFALHAIFFFPQISNTSSDLLTTIFKHLKQIMKKKSSMSILVKVEAHTYENKTLGQEGS
jgi:hypothetical protein